MGSLSVVLAVLTLGLRSAALHIAHNDSSRDVDSPGRVLLVDIRGPTRETGDGVRVMGMLLDLQACGHTVEILSDAADYAELKRSWPSEVAGKYFHAVHFWEAGTTMPDSFKLSTFSRFIIGAKLDLLYTDGTQGLAVPYILSELVTKGVDREKVAAFWDDVPFERCLLRPEAKTICPRVPSVVKEVAQVAHKFYVLSVDDKKRMAFDMKKHGVSESDVDVSVWPMRINNMQQVVPYTPFVPNTSTQNLIVMMGNLHPVNKLMVTKLFGSGAVRKICQAITNHKSRVKIMFLGGLATVAKEQQALHPSGCDCTEVITGYIDDGDLASKIYPKARAILNPFFQDVNSGISVKNFESLMNGIPFLTSEFGMHGLSDEIQACASFPMVSKPGNPSVFAQFVIDHVVDNAAYNQFASAFVEQSAACIEGQMNQYPVENNC